MGATPLHIDVLLPTYNGERFLAEQLASLERQTIASWRLIARDDGSTDRTAAILGEFRRRRPDAVRLIESDGQRLGAMGNFGRLLSVSTAPFIAPCDQDDVWAPDKLACLLAEARRSAADRPVLAHSDLEVVDAELRVLAPSFWRYQRIDPANCQWHRLLVHNVVTGAACLFNSALKSAAGPIPRAAIMHDWWLALVASVAGEIRWVNAPTVKYRQHGSNDTGAKAWNLAHIARQARDSFRPGLVRGRIDAYRAQAAALLALRGARLEPSVRAGLEAFVDVRSRSYPRRIQVLLRHRILKTGLLRNLAFLAHI